jgi:hypothetical protein
VLTPGVVLSLPPKGSKLVTALVHALLFAVLLTLFMECFKMNYQENISEYAEIQTDCDSEADGCGRTKPINPTNLLSNF